MVGVPEEPTHTSAIYEYTRSPLLLQKQVCTLNINHFLVRWWVPLIPFCDWICSPACFIVNFYFLSQIENTFMLNVYPLMPNTWIKKILFQNFQKMLVKIFKKYLKIGSVLSTLKEDLAPCGCGMNMVEGALNYP